MVRRSFRKVCILGWQLWFRIRYQVDMDNSPYCVSNGGSWINFGPPLDGILRRE